MADIKLYSATISDPTPRRLAEYDRMEAARGLQQLSGTVSNIGTKIVDNMDAAGKLQLMHAEAEMAVSALEEEDVWKTNPENDVNDQHYVANFTSNLEKRLERFANGFQTKLGRDGIGLAIRRQVAESSSRIRRAQDEGKVAQIGRAYNETLIKYGNALHQQPNMMVPYLQKFTLMASTLTNLTEAQRQALMTDARQKLAQSAILGEAHVYGPEVALESLSAGVYDLYLEPSVKMQQIQAMTSRIHTEYNRKRALQKEAESAQADVFLKHVYKTASEGGDLSSLIPIAQMLPGVTPAEFKALVDVSESGWAEEDNIENLVTVQNLMTDFQYDAARQVLNENAKTFKASTYSSLSSQLRQARRNEGLLSPRESAQELLDDRLTPFPGDVGFGRKKMNLTIAKQSMHNWLMEHPQATYEEAMRQASQFAFMYGPNFTADEKGGEATMFANIRMMDERQPKAMEELIQARAMLETMEPGPARNQVENTILRLKNELERIKKAKEDEAKYAPR